VIAGEGKILTAGAIDSHIHFHLAAANLRALSKRYYKYVGGERVRQPDTNATTSLPALNREQCFRS